MYEPILIWAGWALLLVLCLPLTGTRWLVLELSRWGLRLALLALLAAGAMLWFRPELLPAEVASVLEDFPSIQDMLPATGTPMFGLAAACLIAAILVPILAVLDLTCRLCRRGFYREEEMVTMSQTEADAAPLAHSQKRSDRRTAAETLAEAGSGKPYRVADHLS